MTLIYRLMEPFETGEFNGPVDEKTKALEAELPRGELRSNTITVEVTEK